MLRPESILRLAFTLALLVAPAGAGAESSESPYELLVGGADEFAVVRDRLFDASREGGREALVAEIQRRGEAGEADAQLLLGHLARLRGEPDEAIRLYRAASEGPPASAPRMRVLADYLARIGRRGEAVAALSRALDVTRDPDERWLLLRDAVRHATRAGDSAAIDALFDRAAREHWRKPHELMVARARALHAAGDSAGAETVWRRVLSETRPRDATRLDAVRDYGRALDSEGRFTDSIALYGGTLSRLPRAHWMRAELLDRVVDAHRRAGTLDDLDGTLRKLARGYEGDLIRARVHEEQGRIAEAIKAYSRLVKRYRFASEPYERLGRLLRLRGDLDGVARLLRRQMRALPGNVRLVFDLARVYADLGRAKKAQSLLSSAARRHAHDPSILAEITDLLVRLDAPPDVVRGMFRKLRRIEPSEPEHIESYGAYLYGLHRLDEARRTWQELLRLPKVREDDGHGQAAVDAHLRLARVLRDHHFDEDAQTTYEAALVLAPENPDVVAAAAAWYERVRRPERALALWRQMVARDSDLREDTTLDAIERVLALMSESGDLDDELEHTVAGVAPKGSLWHGLAGAVLAVRALARLGRTEDAMRVGLERARDLKEPPALLRALLRTARGAGRLEQVLLLIERLRAREPSKNATLLLERAEIQMRLGDDAAARSSLDELVGYAPGDPSIIVRVAGLQERLGEMRAAADTLEQGVADHPEDVTLAFRLAELHRRLGETNRERAVLQRVVRIAERPLDVQRAGRRLIRLAHNAAHLDALDRALSPVLVRAGDPDAARALWLEVRVRQSRMRRLKAILRTDGADDAGPPAIGRLAEALVAGDAVHRARALEAMANDAPEGAAGLLEPLLDDPDIETRVAVLRALGATRDAGVLAALNRRALAPRVRSKTDMVTLSGAIWVLGRLPHDVVIDWEALEKPPLPPEARLGAVLAAALRHDERASNQIGRGLESSNPLLRAAACLALARLGDRAPAPLVARAMGALASERGIAAVGVRLLAITHNDEAARLAVARAVVGGMTDLIADLRVMLAREGSGQLAVDDETHRLWDTVMEDAGSTVTFEPFVRAWLARAVGLAHAGERAADGPAAARLLSTALGEALEGLPPNRRRRRLRDMALSGALRRIELEPTDDRPLCEGLAGALERATSGGISPAERVARLALTGDCTDLPAPAELERVFLLASPPLRRAVLRRLEGATLERPGPMVAALRSGATDDGLATAWLRLARAHGVAVPLDAARAWLQPSSAALVHATLERLAVPTEGALPPELLPPLAKLAESRDEALRAGLHHLICTRPFPPGAPNPSWAVRLRSDPRASVRAACTKQAHP